jgi:hypothetical protein
MLMFLVCDVAYPEDGGSSRQRNTSERNLTV